MCCTRAVYSLSRGLTGCDRCSQGKAPLHTVYGRQCALPENWLAAPPGAARSCDVLECSLQCIAPTAPAASGPPQNRSLTPPATEQQVTLQLPASHLSAACPWVTTCAHAQPGRRRSWTGCTGTQRVPPNGIVAGAAPHESGLQGAWSCAGHVKHRYTQVPGRSGHIAAWWHGGQLCSAAFVQERPGRLAAVSGGCRRRRGSRDRKILRVSLIGVSSIK